MKDFRAESLSHDPLHGYISFISPSDSRPSEVSERELIDHPWVQRLRQIHQLQTAWWVFPTAEHTRFQHVLGVMQLASRAIAALYESLAEACPDVPSRGYVESLLRLAGLLHDVGHGPFGHFFDAHFLARFGLTHETLGCAIIENELSELIQGVRRNPHSQLEEGEQLDPAEISFLITRPTGGDEAVPRWLVMLRSLFCGIYTIDNMDFVLRDAFMSGYSTRAFDLDRLLHYSFFSEHGLTIHDRGLEALLRFMTVRAALFRAVYFHRTVRAIDLMLADLFAVSGELLFIGNPRDELAGYQRFTEWSLLVDVANWPHSDNPRKRELAPHWARLLSRDIPLRMVCQRNLVVREGDAERSSIFSDEGVVAAKIRELLPDSRRETDFKVDIARHIYRPHTRGPATGHNFLYDSAHDALRPLTDDQLFGHLPTATRIVRLYAETDEHATPLAAALDSLLGTSAADDITNM